MRLPPVKIDYLQSFTDDTGIFQHAKYCIPRRSEGYTTDDNARALVACAQYSGLAGENKVSKLARTYLAFLFHMQKPDGGFHNYLSFDRRYLDVDGSDDCLGRALWSCGRTVNSMLSTNAKLAAKEMFDSGLSKVFNSVSLRAYASTLLGLYNYWKAEPKKRLFESTEKLANYMVTGYRNTAEPDWQWFEPYLTYDNARLPQALFNAYTVTNKTVYLDTAKESFEFLLKTQIVDDKFVPVGNKGWYTRGGERAVYDQQPLEAAALVDAAVDAFYATHDQRYVETAFLGFEWFLGRNTKNLVMYNPETGGCFDGLTADSVNPNQGAESSVSYLMARLKLEEMSKTQG